MKTLVVIPTYNEKDNLLSLIEEIHREVELAHILVVDDSSPDGTGELADQASHKYNFVHVLHRKKKEGLGRAYVAGFKWGLHRGYDWLVEMDADFSHRPRDLKKSWAILQGARLYCGLSLGLWRSCGELGSYEKGNQLGRQLLLSLHSGFSAEGLDRGFQCLEGLRFSEGFTGFHYIQWVQLSSGDEVQGPSQWI